MGPAFRLATDGDPPMERAGPPDRGSRSDPVRIQAEHCRKPHGIRHAKLQDNRHSHAAQHLTESLRHCRRACALVDGVCRGIGSDLWHAGSLRRRADAKMLTALYILLVQGGLGTFDTLYYHEYKLRLPAQPHAANELRIHALRDFAYAVLFGTIGWITWNGLCAFLFLALLLTEIV